MKAYQLLARLRLLTLTEIDGELQWMGTFTQWGRVEQEEEAIIRDWEFKSV